MSEAGKDVCGETLAELWSCWPEESAVPAAARGHLAGCPACRTEHAAFVALCRRGSTPEGSPLAWSSVLPAARWTRAAAATRRALAGRGALARPRVWAPALGLGLALAGALLLWRPEPRIPPAPIAPAEAMANAEMLENLDLLENWDVISGDALSGAKEKSGGAP